MAEKNVREFLEAMNGNPEILDYMKGYQLPEGKDKEDGLIDVAAHFGYAFSKEELLSEIESIKGAAAAAGEAASAAVNEITPEEMDAVAGGRTYKEGDVVSCDETGVCWGVPIIRDRNCKGSFIPGENCWYDDACDVGLRWYDNNHCDKSAKLFQSY